MTEITDLSPTDASNTEVTGESLDGNVANMGRMDNTLQAILGMFGRWTGADTIASAATTDIGGQPEAYLTVSGTTTITSFGTVRAGTIRFLRFSGALTLTHNGTSLILPGGANILTAAGDTAIFVSEGSGNWRCLSYQRASGLFLVGGGTAGQIVKVNSAATAVEYSSPGWEYLGAETVSSSANWSKNNLSAFRGIRLLFVGTPVNNDVSLYLRTSTDNGANYDAGASDYISQLSTDFDTSASNLRSTAAQVSLSGDVRNTALGVMAEVLIADFNVASLPIIKGEASYFNSSNFPAQRRVTGARSSSTARNAVRLLFSAGNIAQATIHVWGIRG